MLELRPTCENCNTELPPASTQAMICTYECTFCKRCVDTVLENVCPNCGGGFCQRPVRPSANLKNDLCLATHPASQIVVHNPLNPAAHARFAKKIKSVPAHKR